MKQTLKEEVRKEFDKKFIYILNDIERNGFVPEAPTFARLKAFQDQIIDRTIAHTLEQIDKITHSNAKFHTEKCCGHRHDPKCPAVELKRKLIA